MSQIDDVSKTIAAINPDLYFAGTPWEIKGFKQKIKKAGFENAKDIAKIKPIEDHKIIYDSSSETLEPIYFYTFDLMNQLFGGKVEKIMDNFTSSPGSGHFSELMMKATRMQEEAMKMLGAVNTVIKSIINLIYDLKEFETRLSHYKAAASKDSTKAEAGLLSLKQIWMDNVDIKRGTGSINAMTQQLNFVTLRDSFMAAKNLKEVDNLDLNERVKRILKARLAEFKEWKKRSGIELKKRYEIERTYLKGQVNTLKLYTRWAKPYLKAASQLEAKEFGKEPALVKAFNTIILELTLLGKKPVDFEQAVIDKKLPEAFKGTSKKIRPFYSCVLVDFYFRGIPQKMGQHYVFGGRAEITFRAYALNEDELTMLNQKLGDSDLNDALKLVSGTTEESLEQLQEDIRYFLKEEEERKAEEESGGDVNPFAALIGMAREKPEAKPAKAKEEEKIITKIKKDSYVESMVRKVAEEAAKETCFTLFDVFKKAHGMASAA